MTIYSTLPLVNCESRNTRATQDRRKGAEEWRSRSQKNPDPQSPRRRQHEVRMLSMGGSSRRSVMPTRKATYSTKPPDNPRALLNKSVGEGVGVRGQETAHNRRKSI